MVPPRLCRLVFALLDGLFLVMLAISALAWLLDPLKLPAGARVWEVEPSAPVLVIPLILLLLRLALKVFCARDTPVRGLWEIAIVRKAALAVGGTWLFFLAWEGVLAALKFEAPLPPVVIRGEHSTNEFSEALIPDPDLIWKFNPGKDFKGRRVNAMGFLDREVNPVKAPGAIRVICLGDSCTGQGIPPYSGLLHQRLTNSPPTAAAWEAFNMAVHGYSVVQGLRLFQLRGRALQPDIVTIYYGWNDHWIDRQPDRRRVVLAMPQLAARVYVKLARKRFFQMLVWLAGGTRRPSDDKRTWGYRVPQDDYLKSLAELAREIRAAGAVPLIITAPRAERLTPLLVRNNQARTLDEAMMTHDMYNDLARETARNHAIPILDLAAMFRATECAPLFSDDGIHFKDEGRARIAAEIDRKIREIVKTQEWATRRRKPEG